jgi:putative salt-induced outer membrane protein YdiY
MSLKRVIVIVCAVVFTAGICESLLADELRMKNGDRMTGTVVKMEDKILVFKTSYAGDIPIKWEAVEAVKTDSPVQVVLEDKTSARGILKTMEDGNLQLETDQLVEPLRFVLGHVEGINPPSKPLVNFTGRVNAGVDVKKGNTETDAYTVDGELEARTEKNRYTVGAEANREEESDEKTADNWLLYMSYDHFLTQKWFFYTNADFEQDKFKDLNLRTTVGAGSGYQFFESERKNLSVRGGPAYVNEDYTVDGEDNDYAAGRWAVKYDQYFFDTFVQLFHLHEGTVSLEDTKDIVIRTRTGLRLPLGKGFNTTVQYNWDWDNSPAPDTDRVDERYLMTLGYSWE